MKLLNIHPGVQKLGCATEQVKRPARKLYALERLLDLASQSEDRVVGNDEDAQELFFYGLAMITRDIRHELDVIGETDYSDMALPPAPDVSTQ
jgi:hypothetical protein